VTHLAKKALQMRHTISIHRRNQLKKIDLQRHKLELHIPGTDASPEWCAKTWGLTNVSQGAFDPSPNLRVGSPPRGHIRQAPGFRPFTEALSLGM
jgi:hypothetical protein